MDQHGADMKALGEVPVTIVLKDRALKPGTVF